MLVKTVSGKEIKKINSIMVNEKYYSKKDDCVKIGGKYYPLDHPDLAVDLETGNLNLKGKMLYGITGFLNDTAEYGYFTPTQNNVSCFVGRSKKSVIFREEIIPKNWVEDVATGEFYDPAGLTSSDISAFKKIRTLKAHTEKGYNIEDNEREYEMKKASYENSKVFIPKKIRRTAKLLGDFTFGIENEVAIGTIPDKIQDRLGLVLCRDGSTDGGEFVSVPMSGAKGVYNIKRIAEEMSKRTITDLNCSYHIHIGNIQTSRSFLLSIHKLVEKIQDELFLMLPYYKTFWKGIKRKNYNKKLETHFPIYKPNDRIKNFKDYINYNYAKLFRFLSASELLPCKQWNRSPKTLLTRRHPVGNKWNINSRYYCVNLVNAVFSKRNTVEFRCFQNTTNPTKMVSWLYICAAIVKYAETNAASILTTEKSISLEDVMNVYKDLNPSNKEAHFLSEYLNAYIEDRKLYFEMLISKEDYKGKRETAEDKDFEFFYNGKSIV